MCQLAVRAHYSKHYVVDTTVLHDALSRRWSRNWQGRMNQRCRDAIMSITLRALVQNYFRSANPARGTRAEHRTTIRKWSAWGGGVPIEELGRKQITDFLDWVYERPVNDDGTNPGLRNRML